MRKKRIAVLASGNGSNLKAIIIAIATGKLKNVEIVCVGSNKTDAYALERAKEAGIPTFTLDYKAALQGVKDRTIFAPADLGWQNAVEDEATTQKLTSQAFVENELLDYMKKYAVDLLVCAGYMRVFTKYFLDRFQPDTFNPRVMNIHPSLLPAFPGTDGYGDTWKYGVKVYGPTVHFINSGVDTGPIILQTALYKKRNDTFDSFKERGLRAEWKLYPECIQLFVDGRLIVEPGEEKERNLVRIAPQKFATS